MKLSSVKRDDVASVREAAAQHGGLVIDLRNYPSAIFRELAQHLIEEPTPTVRFTYCDIDNPGAFVWKEPNVLEPLEPFLDIPVAVLVDEVTQSAAELHAITFQAGPQVRVFGSTTAGADGNVSPIPLPGGHQTKLSSIGVFLADDTPTQRVGVPIDHEVRPTVDGIRESRDEVLEAALRWIWGDAAPEAEVVEAARRLPAP